uniref:Uncharacterized protein n=1 Tax=Ditylenchus dipsaci TaxID=166011 RepID=A0A915EDU0_9BILA
MLDKIERNMFWLRGWPFLWLRKLLIFRAQFNNMVSFRNIKWLDGVGDFHEDEVYSNDQLPNYYFTSGDLELCLSPSGRFLFVHLRDQAYVTSEFNSDVSIQTCVIDLLLGEHYNVDINGLSEVSPGDPYYNFVGFYALSDSVVVYLDKFPEQRTLRQQVISINHREHKADCVGHRVFRLNESRFAFAGFIERFDYGPDYCAISNEQGQILRFSKNPVLSGAFAVSTSRHPFLVALRCFLLMLLMICTSHKVLIIQTAGQVRLSIVTFLVLKSYLECHIFTALGRQRGSRVTPVEVTLYPASSSALRTILFVSRLVTASTFCWTSMRCIIEPHFAFSFALYFRLLLSYALSSVREELHKCVRKLFSSHTISYGMLDTSEWRWMSTFYIPGSLPSKIISEESLEQVSYNCTWRTKCVSNPSCPVMNNKCISLRRIVEMKLQRFPNIALKEAVETDRLWAIYSGMLSGAAFVAAVFAPVLHTASVVVLNGLVFLISRLKPGI